MLNGTPRKRSAGALVELAREPAVRDVELEQRVARGERHLRQVGDVPGADDEAARVGIVPDLLDHVGDLIDVPTVRRRPGTPLVAVDRPEVAVLVGPLVPDGDAVLVEPRDVGRRRGRTRSARATTEGTCTFFVVTSGKPSRRSKRIWCPNTDSVPVPVRSSLRTPSSSARRRRSRYCFTRSDCAYPVGRTRVCESDGSCDRDRGAFRGLPRPRRGSSGRNPLRGFLLARRIRTARRCCLARRRRSRRRQAPCRGRASSACRRTGRRSSPHPCRGAGRGR